MAKQATAAGAAVLFHQYNGLPHTFGNIFPELAQSRHLFGEWGAFCRICVEEPELFASSKYYIHEPVLDDFKFKTVMLEVGDGKGFTDMGYEEVLRLIEAKKRTLKVWGGPKRKMAVL